MILLYLECFFVYRNGEHLEHFHSYQKLSTPEEMSDTIELHADQGLFIAFTPAMLAMHDESGAPDLSTPMEESKGFYIETPEGEIALVNFDSEDDLVFMLGDGVNQYVNPMLRKDSDSSSKKLRATPHAVKLDVHDRNLARVWFGLMVLPPAYAFNENENMTYGEIRRVLSTTKNEDIPAGLGCSSTEMRALEGADECFEENAIYCWHRCMPLDDHGVSFDACTADDHEIKCTNPRFQVSDGDSHGDFFPICTDSVLEVTPYPTILEYPQDPEVCTEEAWEAFNEGDYEFSFNLTTDRTDANFYWTPDVEAGTIKGRLVFNGQFGYISFGFINPDPEAGHNGMNGGYVLMATPGSAIDYSAQFGLDLESDKTVAEFQVNENGSSFRHWHTPIGDTTAESFVDDGDCFTSLEFDLEGIHETKFNVTGADTVMWAGNPIDSFAGYHSRNRAIFTVEWATGKAEFGKSLVPPVEEGEEVEETSGAMGAFNGHLSAIVSALVGLYYVVAA